MITRGKIPFVRLLLPLIAGIVSAKAFFLLAAVVITPINIFLLSATIFLVAGYRSFKLYKATWIPGLVIHVMTFMLGMQLTLLKDPRASQIYFDKQGRDALLVTVATEPKYTSGVFRFEGHVKHVLEKGRAKAATGRLLVAVKADSSATAFYYGDMWIIPSAAKEIQSPLNPGEFDYRSFLANRQIYHQVFVEYSDVRKLAAGVGNPVISYALSFRKKLVHHFNRYIPDREAAAIASTLILGYRADLSTEIIQAYSNTGTMHVLSVSGMHVGLVFLVLNAMLNCFVRKKAFGFLKPALIIPLIWYYALITGFSPSVSRSALMLSFFVLGKSLNRSQNSYNLVAISAFFLLLYNPYYLFDVGFQLSYLAVLGLIYVYPKIYHFIYIKNRLLDQVWSYSALSIAAQLATCTLSVYYFHQFPVYFLVSNLFIVLPVTLIMYLGFIFLLVPFPPVSAILGQLLDFLIRMVNAGLYSIENAPHATLDNLWFTSLQLLLLSSVIIFTAIAFQVRNKAMFLGTLILVLLFFISHNYESIRSLRKKEILVYSLRKNTAISFLQGTEATIITDVEQNDKIFSYSIKPYLSAQKVNGQRFYDPIANIPGICRRNFYQFAGYRILRWDRSFNNKHFQYPIKVDAILLTGNPNITLAQLMALVGKSKSIILDSNNSRYRIEKWQSEADQLGLQVHDLKTKGAFRILL